MDRIKFGTDGWRAIIADTYTVSNVKRVAAATAAWLKTLSNEPQVVVGHDTRFGGPLFAATTAQVLAQEGVKVHLARGFVSTPMISLGTLQLGAEGGVVITASHNPPAYNGYKLKAHYGGPAVPDMIQEVEDRIGGAYETSLEPLEAYVRRGQVQYVDLEQRYLDHAQKQFDLESIRRSDLGLVYDSMYGTGQRILRRLLPTAEQLHEDPNPGFNGTAPEPILNNLQELAGRLRARKDLSLGLATDGDADRIGLLDAQGHFIDSHHILLMVIHYLHHYKGLKGKVVNSFSCTSKIDTLCEQLGLEQTITKIGFKYICGHMVEEDVLVGGEESGGIAVKTHVPERDGLWIGLTLMEFMARENKTLPQLIDEVYQQTGPFAMERYDLHITNEIKHKVMEHCQNGAYTAFGDHRVGEIETVDGYKFHLGQDRWVMIRPSGTEPVLRVYAQAEDYAHAIDVLEQTRKAILS